jgi:hypothetical protein
MNTMKAFLVVVMVVMILIACDKDKFQTKPQIEIKSFNTDVVPRNGSLVVIRERLNERALPPTSRILKYKIPEFPDRSKIDMEVLLDGATALTLQSSPIAIPGQQGVFEPDTLNLRFFVIDKQKNVSDTVDRGVIVIR